MTWLNLKSTHTERECELGEDVTQALQLQPTRGALDSAVPADVRREPDPAGDRVIVTLDGKFLPYQW